MTTLSVCKINLNEIRYAESRDFAELKVKNSLISSPYRFQIYFVERLQHLMQEITFSEIIVLLSDYILFIRKIN